VQSLLLLLAPALFAASIYMVLGRIILLTDGEAHSLIRARWLTKLFVMGDVLSFLGQSAGKPPLPFPIKHCPRHKQLWPRGSTKKKKTNTPL
jgi:hypothetical protein